MSGFRKTAKAPGLVVGIDFGTTKIVVIVAQITANGLEIVGVGKEPSLGIRKGMVVNIPSTVEAVKKAAEAASHMAGCDISTAVIGIAGSHIRGFNSTGVVAVKDKEVSRTDVERAIEAAKAVAIPLDREVIHVLPQEFTLDDQQNIKDPVGMAGVRLESKVHIVTGAVASAQNLIKCANLAGMHVVDIILEPLASAEAAVTPDEKELGVALVDIGGGTTDIAIVSRGSVVHTSVIGMGGNHITSDVAVGLRTSIQDAESIKIAHGCAMASLLGEDTPIQVPSVGGTRPKEVARSVLTKIIEPRVEEIFSLVGQELAASHHKHLLSAGVVLTGGTSLMEGIAELAEFTLDLPVRRGMPRGIGGLTDAVSSPIYSTAVGLVQYGFRHQAGVRFRAQDEANIYAKVITRMKAWLGEVF